MDLTWHTEKRKVSELKLLENNPRIISNSDLEKLKNDISSVGNFKPLVCDLDLTILGGNQRMRVINRTGEEEVEVSMPNRKLTENEKKKIIILDNEHRGEFDLDILKKEFMEELDELGFNILGDEKDKYYTREIKAPIYEPNNRKPSIAELVDKEKAEKLIEEIRKLNLDKELEDFLIYSASRFFKFNFSKIADFYANSDKNIQEIMEKLALVIIDYNKAIELGFVELVDELMQIQEEEYE